MPIWVVLFFVLFGGMQLFQWVEGLALPMPFFMAAGILLAIASNADKKAGLPWRSLDLLGGRSLTKPLAGGQPAVTVTPTAPATQTEAPQQQTKRSPELPNFNSPPVQNSISFTIRKSDSSDQVR